MAFELDLAALVARDLPRAKPLSKFPSVRRDLAFIVAEAVAWSELEATASAAAGPCLRSLRLFDVYAGKGVETGFKSVAMGLILQDDSRTLTDRDVDAVVALVTDAVAVAHGARIRS
jgi:phenylalanyl-tRNA synthetase beta chain